MHLAHPTTADTVQEPVSSESGRLLVQRIFQATVLASTLILLTSAASAQNQPRVLLVRAGDGVQLDWAQELGSVLGVQWRARGVDVGAPPQASPEAPAESVGQLERAWASYHALRLEEARTTLLVLVDNLARQWGRGLARPALTDLWLLLAMTHAALGDEAASRTAVERALAVEPAVAVDPTRYPPTLAAQVEAARSAPRAHGTLTLSVAPEAAVIVIDGRPVSSSESTVELPVGTHWVRADAPARASVGTEVELTEAGESIRLTLPIEPALALEAIGGPGDPLPSGALEAVSFLGLSPSILEVERLGGDVLLSLTDAVSGRRVTLRARRPEAARRAPELLDLLLATPDDAPVWPWVAGSAAVLVAGAIALGVLAAAGDGGWNATASR